MNNKESKYNESGINKNTWNLLFSDYDDIPDDEKSDIKNSYIITMIQTYTKFREKSIFSKALKLYFEKKYKVDFSKIKFNEETKSYEYEVEGEIYTFDKLSNKIDNKKIKKELESEKRYKQCHSKSLDLLLAYPEAYIVTGYVKRFDGKYLHSIVEIEKEKGTYIVDYTKNIIMPKEQYEKLTSFEELERISDMEYLQHIQKISNIPGIGLKEYTTFGKELVKDLEKNNFMIENNEELEKWLDEIRKQKLANRKNMQKDKGIEEEERE
jgi:hypothetical protein